MPKINDEVWKLIEPGKAVRVFYGENNPNNKTCHIRAVVDDDQVVYRVWSKRNQYWRYYIDWIYAFQVGWVAGNLKEVAR